MHAIFVEKTNDSDKNSSDYEHKVVHRSIKFKVQVLQNLFVFFKMNGQLQGSGERGTNKCLYFSL